MRIACITIIATLLSIVAAQDELEKFAKKFAEAHKCPMPVCFRQVRNCCWMFSHCGDVKSPGLGRKRCNKKICVSSENAKVCKVECKKEPKKEKRRVCARKLQKVGKVCGKIWFTNKAGKKVCKEACKPKYETRNVCVMKDFIKMEQKCRKKCVKGKKVKCKIFNNWWCYSKDGVTRPKYCPRLKCEKKISQPDKPKDIINGENAYSAELKKQLEEIRKIQEKMLKELENS